ncbi:Uncharacterised protein [Bordetella pertussis]|nr:Uncharacterised protein [Bordetella pertussis]
MANRGPRLAGVQRTGRLPRRRRVRVSASAARRVVMRVMAMAVATLAPPPRPQRLLPDQPRAQQAYHRVRGGFQPLRRTVHRRGRGPQGHRQHRNQRHGHQRLRQRRQQGEPRAVARRLAIGQHVRSNHRLAVAGAQRMEDAIRERQADQHPGRAALGLPGPHRAGQLPVEMRLPHRDLPEPAGQPAGRARGLGHPERMRPLRGGRQRRQTTQYQHGQRACSNYGHVTSIRCVKPLVMANSSSGNASGSAGMAASCCMVAQSSGRGGR